MVFDLKSAKVVNVRDDDEDEKEKEVEGSGLNK